MKEIINQKVKFLGKLFEIIQFIFKENKFAMDLKFESIWLLSSLSGLNYKINELQSTTYHVLNLISTLNKSVNHTNSSIIIEKCLRFIGNIFADFPEIKNSIIFQTDFPKDLIRSLYSNNSDLLLTSLWCFCNLSRDLTHEIIDIFFKFDLNSVLWHLLIKHENSIKIIEEMAWMLSVFTKNLNNYLIEEKIILKIINFISENDRKEIVVPFAMTLNNIAFGFSTKIYESPSLFKLIERGLMSDVYYLKREIIVLLSNLVNYSDFIDVLLNNYNFMNYFVNLLKLGENIYILDIVYVFFNIFIKNSHNYFLYFEQNFGEIFLILKKINETSQNEEIKKMTSQITFLYNNFINSNK